MKNRWYNILGVALAAALTACTEDIGMTGNVVTGNADYINVGGINADELLGSVGSSAEVITRTGDGEDETPSHHAQKAEDVVWLQDALKTGLDITYSNMDADFNHITANERVAILKWTGGKNETSNRGIYTFYYKGTVAENGEGETAKWYDNGPHYFEGQYVPESIRTSGETLTGVADKSQNIVLDQHDDRESGNYTMLSHYIGMPPSWYHSATIDQVLLPFKHRLSRVIVYVLIDPLLNTTIKGYNYNLAEDGTATPDDPQNSSLRFCNVKVLDYVKESDMTVGSGSTESHTSALTPQWTMGRKVIPHFVDEYHSSINADMEPAATDDLANQKYIVYIRKSTEEKIHPRDERWKKVHADYLSQRENSGYTQRLYDRVPVYDIIVRPTYTENDSVMYDEAGYYNSDKSKNDTNIENYCKQINSIDFEMTLESGLTYEKHFEFDLNANWQTVVYLTVDREGVDYDASTIEKWEENPSNDGYYGPNNDIFHNLSNAGSSWQRAYRIKGTGNPNPWVTDGNKYEEPNNYGQYVQESEWIKHFAQAYKGGENHGDYFILDKDITIKASDLPTGFVFTGHLDGHGRDGKCHTITFEGGGQWAVATMYDESQLPLYVKSSSGEYTKYTLPDLYIPNEIAQAKPRKAAGDSNSIDKGEDMMIKQTKTLKEVMTDGVKYYVRNEDGIGYSEFVRPTLWRITPTSLFAGLDANYTTAQESNHNLPANEWEANVHWEKNNNKEYWTPLKGYRAEILNTTIIGGGTFFPFSLPNDKVTGYIYNCKDANGRISNNPGIPEY